MRKMKKKTKKIDFLPLSDRDIEDGFEMTEGQWADEEAFRLAGFPDGWK